ncbi:F-box/kelch-repeat protein At1g51550 [Juglans microcarpa x Juglans regia]|uniref:F-box/kelch-repeat protein At1g51550 n=1 Tax=Juglans microcarpa x Juglans regia TaxID=2249226 RepID=UPI001B7E2AE3|nr:F-box/kelch-repeat protein At1g51550 [Juglans microcarpa x Juglans regia]
MNAGYSMAGTSNAGGGGGGAGNSNSNGSPITNIAQDHIITILLLLPIDSILSFAMTCKRFRALVFSDSLWESICRRDWGPKSVDALKSSNLHSQQQQLPWMRLYKQVSRLESVSCINLTYTDGELVLPRPRASHSLNFVSDCLVLFGGGCEGGRHLDDTWVSYIGKDFQKMLQWQKVNSGIPSGRFGHTCVVMGDCLVLFGGINDHGDRQNDIWVGQVTCHETLGITLSWRLLDVQSVAPAPRGAHAACSIDDRLMLIHGGIGLNGLRLGDTWVLELSENLCYGVWREILTYPSPPARSGHTLTCIGGTRIVLFGGRGLGYEVLNDVWILDMPETCLKWVQIPYELPNIPEGVSLPRVGHSATPILGGRLLIYGGEDSYRHRKDDFWVLDISAIPSINVQPTTLNSRGLLAKMWKRFQAIGYKPNSRSFHRACADPSGRYLYVFGGMIDGFLQPVGSSGLTFDGELFLVELVLQL